MRRHPRTGVPITAVAAPVVPALVEPTGSVVTPEAVQFVNPARRVGLRQRVKSGEMTPAAALEWLRSVDPRPNHTTIAWLERRARNRGKAEA